MLRWTVLLVCTMTFVGLGCTAPMTAPAPAAGTPPVPGAGAAAAAAPAAAPTAGAAGGAAAGGAGAGKATLPQFLGLGQACQGIGNLVHHVQNHLGMFFPGLEPKPALLPIAGAGGDGASPAVAAAAEIKAEEDKAAQKVKAIRYLASLGCLSCYDGIEEGLLAALDDCTEEVRYEAVKGLRKAAGEPCKACQAASCCTPKVVKRLYEIANKMDDQGCYVESSARVRRMARLALARCGGAVAVATEEPTPDEGPAGDTVSEPTPEEIPEPQAAGAATS